MREVVEDERVGRGEHGGQRARFVEQPAEHRRAPVVQLRRGARFVEVAVKRMMGVAHGPRAVRSIFDATLDARGRLAVGRDREGERLQRVPGAVRNPSPRA